MMQIKEKRMFENFDGIHIINQVECDVAPVYI